MHINIEDTKAVTITTSVVERVLLANEESKTGGLSAKHYTLTGGEIIFENPNVEYQHYILSGHALYSGRIVNTDTAIFKPNSIRFQDPDSKDAIIEAPKHSISHFGEGETRILTLTYETPRPNFRWAKSRIKNLHEVPYQRVGWYWGTQLFTEEEHAVMGALRMHALDVQTNPPGISLPRHRNPEEIMYFIGGKGKAISEDIEHDVKAGSFIYTPEGEVHGICNTHETLPLHYIVVEFIEHEKMWAERAYIKNDWRPTWEKK
jgi:mannose-6-phosphate isomerase-like protein (cupin superfamily)